MADLGKGARTLGRALRYVPKAMYRALRDEMTEVFSEPMKFVIFIILVIALIALSSFLSVFMFSLPYIIFLFAVWFAKREGALDRGRKRYTYGAVMILSAMVLTPSVFGYIYYEVSKMHPAEVPQDHLYNTGWEPDHDLDINMVIYYGMARMSTRGYMHEVATDGDYPGTLLIVTFKSVPLVSEGMVMDQVKEQIEGYNQEGLTIDLGTEHKGTRTLHDGSKAQFIEYDAVVSTDTDDNAIRSFKTGAKLKVRGEVWTNAKEGVILSGVGFAQYGWTFDEGSYSAKLAQVRNQYPDDLGTYTDLKNHIYYVEY